MEKKVVLWLRTTPLFTRKSARAEAADVGVLLTTPVALLRASPAGNPKEEKGFVAPATEVEVLSWNVNGFPAAPLT
jgi:hypothetical protein